MWMRGWNAHTRAPAAEEVMARRSGGRSGGRGGSKGGARKGSSRARRDEYEEDDYDERPRRSRSANAGPNMMLILGSVGGLILLLVVGMVLINSTEDSRRAEEQAKEEAWERDKAEKEAAAAARAKEVNAKKNAKLAAEAPWMKAMEKILAPLKKKMNKEKTVKRYILAFSFANDRPTFYFPVRPKFFTGPSDEVTETCQLLCDLVEELCQKGFAHAEEGGYPVKNKTIKIMFKEKTTEADKKDNPDAGKWRREVGTYSNGTFTLKR
jgi:hypothetical protein